MNLKSKTILVATHGLFISQAQRLARDFGKVLLYCPWEAPTNPTMNVGMLGYGLDGITRVESIFGPHFDEVDIFYMPDTGLADVAVYLDSLGKRVWSGRNGEELENYRDLCKEIMEKKGLAVQPWKKLIGMDALRAYLKIHKNQFVKLNRWRGHFESFKSENYEWSEAKLNEIEHQMGPFSKIAEFICEDELPDCVEIGIDTFCIDGQFPGHTVVGLEVKDLGYLGQFMSWDSIPKPIRQWHEAMADILKKYRYRGWISNETRIRKDKKGFMIDATCRAPSPPSELFQEQYANFPEIIWKGAGGEMEQPQAAAKWGCQIILKTHWAGKNFLPVKFDPKFSKQIKLYDPIKIDGMHYVVPLDEDEKEFASVIGLGPTIEKAVENMREAADSIHAYGAEVPDGSVDKAREEMDKLKEFGVSPFTGT